ncbi:MAG: hypothetical protein KC561_02615, partial [Myxococcales bacterium]|nr:hypothetical protein [Myxococcales bacterium]
WGSDTCLSAREIRDTLGVYYSLEPEGFRSGKGPARYWRIKGPGTPADGHSIGIISAVTECFCDACNRVRLTAQGGLRACLADDGEVDLRAILRSGADPDQLVAGVRQALWGKKESHAFDINGGGVTYKQMVSIGG